MVCLKSLARLDDAVGAIVAAKVAAKELSLSALARRCECSEAHLSNWSRGRRRASLSLLDDVLTVFKLAPCDVLKCEGCAGNRSGVMVATVRAIVAPGSADPPRPRKRREPSRRRRTPEELVA